MRTQIQLCLALTLATITLFSAVAGAETLTMTPAREITLVSLGAITFETNVLGVHVECNVTLSGSLMTGSFATVPGTTIGTLTRSTISGCSGGTVRPLIEAGTPWRIAYEGIDGRFAQEVTGYQLKVVGTRVLAEISGFASCLFTGDLGVDVPTTYSELGEANQDIASRTGLVTLQRERETFSSIVRLSGSFTCPTEPSVLGTYRLEPQQSIRQANTRAQIGLPTNITFTAVNEQRTITLRNNSTIRNEQLEDTLPIIYTREGATGAFRREGGTCARVTILSRDAGSGGGTCTIIMRFLGPVGSTSRLAIDFFTISTRPGIQGNLIG